MNTAYYSLLSLLGSLRNRENLLFKLSCITVLPSAFNYWPSPVLTCSFCQRHQSNSGTLLLSIHKINVCLPCHYPALPLIYCYTHWKPNNLCTFSLIRFMNKIPSYKRYQNTRIIPRHLYLFDQPAQNPYAEKIKLIPEDIRLKSFFQ